MKEKIRTYTAEDFTRYHAGTMPADEMHALEKAVLEDPFLLDALEGYQLTSSAGSDIAELHQRLNDKRKNKNIFLLFNEATNGWWRIAALFIVIAGVTYFFYSVNDTEKENSIAKNETKPPSVKEESKPLFKSDSISKNDNASAMQQSATFEKKEKITLPLSKSKRIKEVPVVESSAYSLTADSIRGSEAESYSDKSSNEDVKVASGSPSTKRYVLKGKITDEEGNAIPLASVANKTQNVQTITDTSGRFFLQSPDSNIMVTASAIGYATKIFTLEKDKQPTIEIAKNDARLSEVVVTGMGISKKAKVSNRALSEKASGIQITQAAPYPSGGEDKFNSYIKENADSLYDEKGIPLSGEVSLAFSLNKKGRPENIIVTKSSCKACEEKAIFLLKNGPDWIGKKNQKGKVLIKF